MSKRIGLLALVLLMIIGCFGFKTMSEAKTSTLSDKELKERIGQMLMVGFRDTEVSEDSFIVEAVRTLNLGGVVLYNYDVPSKSFPRNIINPEQTKKLIEDLQRFSPSPLFIAVDAEGGKWVNRLKEEYGFSLHVPSAQEMGEKDPAETKKIALQIARQLADLGFNVNFAPVVDVNINPDNPVIGAIERSFSKDPKKVVDHTLAFITAHHERQIITTIKHYPGHGSSENDSHLGMVDITDTYRQEELIPFCKLISLGVVDMVMVAHVINRNIDPEYPATLSPLFIKEILRQQLGFQGVVISDDMQMGAITKEFGFAEAIVRAINAGCDMLIISNNGAVYDETAPHRAVEIIFNAVKSGEISIERIVASSNRIEKLKMKI